MCAKHDENGEHFMGHWMPVGTPDPYLAGGGNDGAWDWRHPRTCTASTSSSVCVFSEVENCRPGYENWGKARIIMEAGSDLSFNAGAMSAWGNYHTPWLCCTEGITTTKEPTTKPTNEPTEQTDEPTSSPTTFSKAREYLCYVKYIFYLVYVPLNKTFPYLFLKLYLMSRFVI
jgi:hypothetical protein